MEEKSTQQNTPNPVGENKRQIFKLSATLALSFFSVLFAIGAFLYTYGWFSNNLKNAVSGMAVSVQSSPNLIISDQASDVTNNTGLSVSSLYRKVFNVNTTVFSSGIAELEPAWHSTKTGTLQAIDDWDLVSASTGMATGGSDNLVFTDAEINKNYVEFVTYVGSSGSALSYEDLTLSLDLSRCYTQCEKGFVPVSDGSVTYYTRSGSVFKAATPTDTSSTVYYTHSFAGVYQTTSADVLFNDVYKGTITPAAPSLVLSDSGTILPSSPVRVTLRVFFDGSMREDSTKAILRAGEQMPNQVFLAFTYTAESDS